MSVPFLRINVMDFLKPSEKNRNISREHDVDCVNSDVEWYTINFDCALNFAMLWDKTSVFLSEPPVHFPPVREEWDPPPRALSPRPSPRPLLNRPSHSCRVCRLRPPHIRPALGIFSMALFGCCLFESALCEKERSKTSQRRRSSHGYAGT